MLIVAEMGLNHNGNTNLLKRMIDSAWLCGVDFIKFQKYKTHEFMSWDNQHFKMFKDCELTDNEWLEIVNYCEAKHISYFFTPQNKTDLDFLEKFTRLTKIKIGSDDLTNLELIEYCASRHRPMILSTGMSTEQEIEAAVNASTKMGNCDITLLHCTSTYPTTPQEVNMLKMQALSKYADRVGYSDHTVGNTAALMAASMGAVMIEKHYTLSHSAPGPDQWFSADQDEMRRLVSAIRSIEIMFGSAKLEPTEQELVMRKVARRTKNKEGVYLRATL